MLHLRIMLKRSMKEGGGTDRLREALNLQTVVRKSTVEAVVLLHETRRQWGARACREVEPLLGQLEHVPPDVERAIRRATAAHAEFEARVDGALADAAHESASSNAYRDMTKVSLPPAALATTFGTEATATDALCAGGSVSCRAARDWLSREERHGAPGRSGVLPVVSGMRGVSQWFGGAAKRAEGQNERVVLDLVGRVEAELDELRRVLAEQGRLTQLTRKHGAAVVQEAQRLRGAGRLDCSRCGPEHQQSMRRLTTALNSLSNSLVRRFELG